MEQRTFHYIRELASGGMGRVDLVVRREGRFRRLYAAKRLHAHLRQEHEVVEMFLDEARLAGLIRHPNVVPVLDVVQDGGDPYLLMEYVGGVSLAKLVLPHAETSTKFPLPIALDIAIQAAMGLHAAHELEDEHGRNLGLVHRDVSPQNILIGFDGCARLTDFGIAKALDGTSRTRTGMIKGKAGYMSPEQLRFESIDRRSDLFCLGVVLYEMLTARRLYSDRDGLGSRHILHEPVPDLGAEREDVPPALVELMFEILAKNPEDRPAHAHEIADRLRAVQEEVTFGDASAELGAYVRATCRDIYESEQTSLSDAMRALDAGELPTWPLVADGPVLPVRKSAGRRWAVIALGLMLAVGVGAVIGQSFGAEPDRPPDPTEASAEPASEPVPREPVARVDPSGAESVPTRDEPAQEPEVTASDSPTRPRPNRHPHRTRLHVVEGAPEEPSTPPEASPEPTMAEPREGPLWRIQ